MKSVIYGKMDAHIAAVAVLIVVLCVAVFWSMTCWLKRHTPVPDLATKLYEELETQPVKTSEYCGPNLIVPRLYLGGVRAASAESLKKYHITAVLNMAAQLSLDDDAPRNTTVARLDVKAVDLPFYDMAQHFDDAYQFIEENLKERNGRVLVHCFAGVSRSATIVAMYLQRKNGWNTKQALEYIKARRSVILPNVGFIRDLVDDYNKNKPV